MNTTPGLYGNPMPKDYTDVVLGLIVIALAIAYAVWKRHKQYLKTYVAKTRQDFEVTLEERKAAGEPMVTSVTQPLGQVVTVPAPTPEPAKTRDHYYEEHQPTRKTGIANQLSREELRRALIWSEILSSRGGRRKR